MTTPPPPVPDESRRFLGGSHHPWRRLFARIVDVSTVGLLELFFLVVGLTLALPGRSDAFVKALNNPILGGLVLQALWIPVEALLLTTAGTTPGKALFGISVRELSGRHLTFGKALERALRVTVQGVGLGLPLISLFTQLFAYRRLTRIGTTRWDTATGAVVGHQALGVGRRVVCIVTMVAVFALLLVFNTMGR